MAPCRGLLLAHLFTPSAMLSSASACSEHAEAGRLPASAAGPTTPPSLIVSYCLCLGAAMDQSRLQPTGMRSRSRHAAFCDVPCLCSAIADKVYPASAAICLCISSTHRGNVHLGHMFICARLQESLLPVRID